MGPVAETRDSVPGVVARVIEELAVFKMLFFRPKDVLDVKRMLEVQGARFDRGFVRDALVEMLGDDPRIAKWDELTGPDQE